jgi:hypothetical protein
MSIATAVDMVQAAKELSNSNALKPFLLIKIHMLSTAKERVTFPDVGSPLFLPQNVNLFRIGTARMWSRVIQTASQRITSAWNVSGPSCWWRLKSSSSS